MYGKTYGLYLVIKVSVSCIWNFCEFCIDHKLQHTIYLAIPSFTFFILLLIFLKSLCCTKLHSNYLRKVSTGHGSTTGGWLLEVWPGLTGGLGLIAVWIEAATLECVCRQMGPFQWIQQCRYFVLFYRFHGANWILEYRRFIHDIVKDEIWFSCKTIFILYWETNISLFNTVKSISPFLS